MGAATILMFNVAPCRELSRGRSGRHIKTADSFQDAGCTSELDYTEKTSWLLILKYLDTLENDKATEAFLNGRKCTHILVG